MGKALLYTPFVMFRDIIGVPNTYRAVRPRKKPVRRQVPEPEKSVIDRLEQLKAAGIDARLEYERFTKSYSIAYRLAPGQEMPEWR